jgi:hypothetical protein
VETRPILPYNLDSLKKYCTVAQSLPTAHLIYTDKKENQVFLIYKEIQSGAVATSCMRKDFLIHEEMRKYFTIYKEAVT